MLLSVYNNIIGWAEQHQLPCLFKTIFHFDCPGCGLQRSVIALLRGKFQQSFSFYPATPLLLFLVAYFIFFLIRRNENGAKNIRILFTLCAVVIFIQYACKIIRLVN